MAKKPKIEKHVQGMLKEVQDQLQALEDTRREVEKELAVKRQQTLEAIERDQLQVSIAAKKSEAAQLKVQARREREF